MTEDNEKEVSKKLSFRSSVLGLKIENKIGDLLINSNDCWSKLEAQENYLSTPPVCFIILSKPGLGEKILGDKLAEYWKCIHINPDDIIQDQINLKSNSGRCIEFNLRCGNVITVDVIMRLIEEYVKSDVVQHRGYVLSGIPLVETYKSNDCCGRIYSEEAFLIVEELMTKLILDTLKLESAESIDGEGPEIDEDEPKDSNIEVENENIYTITSVDYSILISGVIPLLRKKECCRRFPLHEQIGMIDNLQIRPTLIINISCPEDDIISLRGQNAIIYPKCYTYQIPFESEVNMTNFNEVGGRLSGNDKYDVPKNISSYQCWRPFDFSHFVEAQLKKMTQNFKDIIKKFLYLHDPQYVLKLDGRCSHDKNFEIVQNKLSVCPFHRVLLPTLLKEFRSKNSEMEENENSQVDNVASGEFLRIFEENEKLSPRFPYSESIWRTKCPVALSDGKTVIGSPKYAVILFDHIILLSSNDAVQSFCRNPRQFFNKKFLTPSRRIAILGAKKSGKSTLAKCLSWLFKCAVIDFQRIKQKLLSDKEHIIFKKAWDETFIISSKICEENWLEKEQLRLASLAEWQQEALKIIERYSEMDEAEIHDLLRHFKRPFTFSSKQKLLKSSRSKSSSLYSRKSSSIRKSVLYSTSTFSTLTNDSVSIKDSSTIKGSSFLKGPSSFNDSVINDSTVIKDSVSNKNSTSINKLSAVKKSTSVKSSKISKSSITTKSLKKTSKTIDQASVSTISSVTESLKWVVQNVFFGTVDESTFIKFCQKVIEDPDILLQYAPSNIRDPSVLESPNEEKVSQRARKLITEEDRYDGVTVTDEEIIYLLIEKILIAEQAEDNERKESGWIIDGMSCEPQFWEALANAGCLPEDVFCLKESSNIDLEMFLLHKSRRKNDKTLSAIFDKMEEPLLDLQQKSLESYNKSAIISKISNLITAVIETDYFEDNKLRSIPTGMTEKSVEALKESEFNTFTSEIAQFNEAYKSVKTLMNQFLIEPIEIIIPIAWSPSELISESLRLLRYRYGVNCKKFVPETNKAEEDEQLDLDQSNQIFYGICGPYCPVTFYKHGVVWKGRDEFAQNYKQNTYFMVSAETESEFIADPERFLYAEKPIDFIPPWRICIAGPIGSGRSTMGKLLADKMGLIYINFCNFTFSCLLQCPRGNSRDFYDWLDEPGITKIIDESVSLPSEIDLELRAQLKSYFVENATLSSEILNCILSKLWFTEPFSKTGIVIDGFPCNPSDVEIMKDFFYIPDLIIEMRASFVEVNKRLYELFCQEWKTQQKIRQDEYEKEKESSIDRWNSQRNSLFNAYFIYLEVENNAFIIIDSHLDDSQNEEYGYDELDSVRMDTPSPHNTFPPVVPIAKPSEYSSRRSGNNLSVSTRSEFSSLSKSSLSFFDLPDEEIGLKSKFSKSSLLPFFDIPDEEINYVTFRIDVAYPELEFENEWETEENAFERIKSHLSEWYESDMQTLSNVKEQCESELIPWFPIDSLRRNDRTLSIIYKYISTKMKHRNESFFEQTTIVDIELAELLISRGFYFLSKFGISCPVRVFEKESLVQMFLHDKANGNIFPVLHRSYVYFCSGNENCSKFCKNPLIYIYSTKINFIVHMPIKLAIIGPPKCGKSTLASRFQEEFGISIKTRGHAIRSVLEKFYWTSLARQMCLHLSAGETLPMELKMQAVHLSTMDAKSLVQGFIFDGFPQQTGDSVFLKEYGLFPYLIFELECDVKISKEYLQTEPAYFLQIPRISEPFLVHRFKISTARIRIFLLLVRQFYQNSEKICASWSKWQCWWEAKKHFYAYVADLVCLFVNSPGMVIPMGRFCISEQEFDQGASPLKDYCPTCLSNGLLRKSGEVFNRIGLVLWNSTFYWFCHEHYAAFIEDPYVINMSLPDSIPKRSYELHPKQFYEKGRCIVTFSDNYPTRVVVDGSIEFSATYKDNTYIFANYKCLNNFLENPEKYYDKVIHYEADPPLPFLDVSQLPVLGYLEQCLSDIIIKATVHVSKFRPKYPGISPSVSAAILMGLFLKCNNPKMTPDELKVFQKVKNDFEDRCKKPKEFLDFMNSNENPFIQRANCCGFSDTYSLYSDITVESSPLQSRQLSSDHITQTEHTGEG